MSFGPPGALWGPVAPGLAMGVAPATAAAAAAGPCRSLTFRTERHIHGPIHMLVEADDLEIIAHGIGMAIETLQAHLIGHVFLMGSTHGGEINGKAAVIGMTRLAVQRARIVIDLAIRSLPIAMAVHIGTGPVVPEHLWTPAGREINLRLAWRVVVHHEMTRGQDVEGLDMTLRTTEGPMFGRIDYVGTVRPE